MPASALHTAKRERPGGGDRCRAPWLKLWIACALRLRRAVVGTSVPRLAPRLLLAGAESTQYAESPVGAGRSLSRGDRI